MKYNKGAFIDATHAAMEDAIKQVTARLAGLPHTPMQWPKLTYYILECLEDHIRCIDAGVGDIKVKVAKGEIVETQDLSIHSLDISKFKLLRTEAK